MLVNTSCLLLFLGGSLLLAALATVLLASNETVIGPSDSASFRFPSFPPGGSVPDADPKTTPPSPAPVVSITPPTATTAATEVTSEAELCIDKYPDICAKVASLRLCVSDPHDQYAESCPYTCGLCLRMPDQLHDTGVKQVVKVAPIIGRKIMGLLLETKTYVEELAKEAQLDSMTHEEVEGLRAPSLFEAVCTYKHKWCGYYAARGSCETDPDFMKTFCAPTCRACGQLMKTIAGPQLVQGREPEYILYDNTDVGRYYEEKANHPWTRHRFLAQTLRVHSRDRYMYPIVRFHCGGTIVGRFPGAGVAIMLALHCTEYPLQDLYVRVYSANATKESDGCLAHVKKIHYQPVVSTDTLDWKNRTHGSAEADVAVIELETGQCIDSARYAIKLWSGDDILRTLLRQSPVPSPALEISPNRERIRLDEDGNPHRVGYDCRNGDLGELFVPHHAYDFHRRANPVAHRFVYMKRKLIECNQTGVVKMTTEFDTMFKQRWGQRPDSNQLDLQFIEMAMWHHPCALGLMSLGWPPKFMCATPTRKWNCKGKLGGDSGSPLLYYDAKAKEYFMVGVQSKGIDDTTNIFAALDAMLDTRTWLKELLLNGDSDGVGAPATTHTETAMMCMKNESTTRSLFSEFL
mmetsp:Transcript_18822/g.37757  ORF Transcript_18822/g.37757 Transcript_18822/m.37757 type:complete len:634 (-) Transcript_18822:1507-3408(-)